MSGETQREVSGWTTDTLHELMTVRFIASEKAVNAALAAAEKAGDKADAAIEKRFDGVNEFRKTLSDQAGQFVQRVEYQAGFQSLSDKVEALGKRVERWEGHGAGITDATKVIYAVVGLIVVVGAALIGHNFR